MGSKKKSKEAIEAVERLTEAKNDLLHKQAKDQADTLKKAIDLASSPALSEAFKSVHDLEKFQNSMSGITKISEMAKTLSGFEDYLKPDYGYVAKAADQVKAMQESLGLPKSALEEFKSVSKKLKDMYEPLGYAAELSKTASAMNQSGLIKVLKEQEEKQKKISQGISAQTFSVEPARVDLSEMNRTFMELEQKRAEKAAKKEKREESLLENSEAQKEKLENIATYMFQQSEVFRLQNEILEEQVANLKIQNESSKQQVNEIKEQNRLMREQQEENRKSAKTALWIAIVSVILGVIVGAIGIWLSYYLYTKQDISDNKNHAELLQTIKESSKKEELTPLLQQQLESSRKTNQLLNELIKKSSSKATKLQKKQ